MRNKQKSILTDSFFVLFITIDERYLTVVAYFLSCKLVLSSYLDRFSLSIRANSAALSSFP
jgi:hypothetical protein